MDRVRGGNNLRNRQTEIHIGLEIDFLHPNSVDGLSLEVSDPVNVRAERLTMGAALI